MIDTLTCTACGVQFPPGRRTSQESYEDAATKAGWLLGWPAQKVFCPDHHPGEE